MDERLKRSKFMNPKQTDTSFYGQISRQIWSCSNEKKIIPQYAQLLFFPKKKSPTSKLRELFILNILEVLW